MDQGQNLIDQARASLALSVEKKRRGTYKLIALDASSILAAFVLGYSYREYLANGLSPWAIFAAFLVFGAVSALQALLCKETNRRAFIILCEVAVLGIFFYAVDWRFLCAAGAIAFILFFWGYLKSRSEIDYGMDIRLFKATRGVIGNVLTGTIIFMIVIYLPLWQPGSAFISQENFNVFFGWVSGTLNAFYPNVNISGSFGEFANGIVSSQLDTVPAFQSMSPMDQAAAITQSASAVLNNLSKSMKIAIQPSDTVSAVVYRLIVNTLAGWKDRFQGAFLAGWSIAVFFLLRSAGIIFVWIDQLLLLIFYEILRVFRLIRIKEEPWTKEVIEY